MQPGNLNGFRYILPILPFRETGVFESMKNGLKPVGHS